MALATVSGDALAAANARIVVIGCGDWQPIEQYAGKLLLIRCIVTTAEMLIETTGFTGTIYADPTRDLYHALGMDIESLKMAPSDQRKSYLRSGTLSNALRSIWVGKHKYYYPYSNSTV